MARKQGSGSTQHIVGLYESERVRLAGVAQQPDPRLWDPENGWPTDPAELQKLIDVSPYAHSARRQLESMAAGEPIEVATSGLRRRHEAAIP